MSFFCLLWKWYQKKISLFFWLRSFPLNFPLFFLKFMLYITLIFFSHFGKKSWFFLSRFFRFIFPHKIVIFFSDIIFLSTPNFHRKNSLFFQNFTDFLSYEIRDNSTYYFLLFPNKYIRTQKIHPKAKFSLFSEKHRNFILKSKNIRIHRKFWKK